MGRENREMEERGGGRAKGKRNGRERGESRAKGKNIFPEK